MKKTLDYEVSKEVAMAMGKVKRERLIGMLQRFLDANQQEAYPHVVISSRPGLGKTHTVLQFFRDSEVPYYVVSGSTSLFGLLIAIAVIQYLNDGYLTLNVLIDDCDGLLSEVNSLNTLKSILGKDGHLRYEKSMASQLRTLTETQRKAVEHFSDNGRMGFVVPTHNLRFVLNTNIVLPNEDRIHVESQKGSPKSILMIHQNAIRSRCRVLDINLKDHEAWGWIADVIHNTDCLTSKGLTYEQIVHISDYLWTHWSRLSERSIRTAEKMAETILANPNPMVYHKNWDLDYLP